MKQGKKVAKQYLSYGLNPLPILEGSKAPIIKDHNTVKMTEQEIGQHDFEAIGVSTGIISGGLEAIDFDLKNAEYPDAVMKVFKAKVSEELLKKLVVQRTQSGGYHFIYRCEDISSSKKLAKNPEGKAIIETRGEGGLIKCYPSKGYDLLQGTFDKIPIITPEERLSLFISAKMLNQTMKKDAMKRASREDLQAFKKFPKYNEDPDIGVKLLEEAGWTYKNQDSEWINFTRPNSKSGDIHAGYHKDGKFFFCFSTAQDMFEEEKPYNNHALYAMTKCDGNYAKAYAQLYEMGYGVESGQRIQISESSEEEDWQQQLDNLEFLSDDIEENTYLEQARKNEIEQGLTTGWRALDEHFRFKRNSLNVGLGLDGVGKSVKMLSLANASNTLHDWKWGMIMPENKTAMSRRRLIESKFGRGITSFTDAKLFDQYVKESREAFKIISNKKHYSIKDVIEMGKRLYEFYGIDALLIDPWNFFKVEGNAHSHNNEMLSILRVFAESYCSVYVMAHPNSTAARVNLDADGYLKPPSKYDIQGGADFPYRVDDFFIYHRIVNHEDLEVKRTMQFIVEKLKETETGGKVHTKGEYTGLIYEERDGFLGYWDEYGDNPMYKALLNKQKNITLRTISPEEAFGL